MCTPLLERLLLVNTEHDADTVVVFQGGMRATVWNDAFQMLVILAAFLIAVIIGADKVGGFQYAMDTAREGGRLDMNK